MRLTLSKLSKAATSTSTTALDLNHYLTSLKATQLKHIARATGIHSTGRKDVLQKRIGEEVLSSVFLDADADVVGNERKRRELSVLSIDMGIQNLAFAHLLVKAPPSLSSLGDRVDGEGETETGDGMDDGTIRRGSIALNAWHRIGVQDLAAARQNHGQQLYKDTDTDTDTNRDSEILRSLLPRAAFRTFTNEAGNKSDNLITSEEEKETSIPSTGNNNFEPQILSHNAFILLFSLIRAYKPTHILIERQRFRSGGQSAVLEWSLRVGVFEGMLHAVLRTMRELSQLQRQQGMDMDISHSSQSGSESESELIEVMQGLQVWSISPAMVMQYWDNDKRSVLDVDQLDASNSSSSSNSGKEMSNQRKVKKLKMDIIGNLLLASSSSALSATESSGNNPLLSCWNDIDIDIDTSTSSSSHSVNSQNSEVRDVVNAYIRRWGNSRDIPRGGKTVRKIDKLDDLADCLLQGLTWLDWQARRARIARGDRPV